MLGYVTSVLRAALKEKKNHSQPRDHEAFDSYNSNLSGGISTVNIHINK